ncbi:hypothetical protein [Acidipropionibacterium acidipropionici]|uniref:hypothetical protein n=1 Tax=Acidipropionibacterium acidipropionici TaxID=1748 RepID=UPI00055B9FE6|nr:hypothetical protein [Acidipropionibacterium acidipropionici]ALN15616.1 hypothetical protein ASQ49_10440 [Acidipropionibacterium acidipropionici]QCV94630.1 hypothetical protein FEZ30_04515 [Acidipropionibacterium acidipropionici]
MSEAAVAMTALVPMKVLPGWPEASYSGFHVLVLCVLAPLAVAVLFALIGKAPGWLRARHAEEVEEEIADPDVTATTSVIARPQRAELD